MHEGIGRQTFNGKIPNQHGHDHDAPAYAEQTRGKSGYDAQGGVNEKTDTEKVDGQILCEAKG